MIKKLKEIWKETSVRWAFYALVGAVTILALLSIFVIDDPSDGYSAIIIEGYGFLFDIFLFGIALVIYDHFRERRGTIRDYHNQFEDYKTWGETEGILRKVGIIKRLNEMGAELPDMSHANLQGAKLDHANLQGSYLGSANLQEADLSYANLQKAVLHNANLQRAKLLFADLQRAELLRADLQGAELHEANLQGSFPMDANLQGAGLGKANLQGAKLRMANLQGAELNGANLQGAELTGAGFKRANLKNTNFQGADLYHTCFNSANLREAKNLTLEQLGTVIWDDRTKWPAYIDPKELIVNE